MTSGTEFKVGIKNFRITLFGVPPDVRINLHRLKKLLYFVSFIISIGGVFAYFYSYVLGTRLLGFALFILLSIDISSSISKYGHRSSVRLPKMQVGDNLTYPGPITLPWIEYYDARDDQVNPPNIWRPPEKARIGLTPTHLAILEDDESVMVDLSEEVQRISITQVDFTQFENISEEDISEFRAEIS